MTPAWILDVLAALMLVVAAVSATRLAVAQPWRQHLLQFQKRAHRRLLNPRYASAGGSAQPDRNRDGFLIVEQ